MDASLARRLTAEGLGTALLLAVVVGSGIMGERLAGGNDAIALLANTLATGAGLVVLISVFAPLSGAHFNPVVSLYFLLRREATLSQTIGYIAVQIAGAVLGVWAAHVMFGLPLLQTSHKLRDGFALAFSDGVATCCWSSRAASAIAPPCRCWWGSISRPPTGSRPPPPSPIPPSPSRVR